MTSKVATVYVTITMDMVPLAEACRRLDHSLRKFNAVWNRKSWQAVTTQDGVTRIVCR